MQLHSLVVELEDPDIVVKILYVTGDSWLISLISPGNSSSISLAALVFRNGACAVIIGGGFSHHEVLGPVIA